MMEESRFTVVESLGLAVFFILGACAFLSVAHSAGLSSDVVKDRSKNQADLDLVGDRTNSNVLSRRVALGESVSLQIGSGQGEFLKVQVNLRRSGRSSYVSGILSLKNYQNRPFQIKLKYPRRIKAAGVSGKGRIYQPKVNARSTMRAQSTRRLRFGFSLEGNGKHLAALQLQIFGGSGEYLGSQHVYLYFLVQNRRYRHASYRELYLANAGPILAQQFPANERVVPNPRRPVFDFELDSPLPDTLPLHNRGIKVVDYPPSHTGVVTSGSDFATPQRLLDQKSLLSEKWNILQLLPDFLSIPEAKAYQPSSYSVTGAWFYKGVDNKLHPGWGWTVELFWRNKHKLASGLVKYDGHFFLSFKHKDTLQMAPGGYDQHDLTVRFVMKNQFVSFQPSSHLSKVLFEDWPTRIQEPYAWEKEYGIQVGNLQFIVDPNLDVGQLIADMSLNGNRAGIGDAFYSAMQFLNKFTINGINPIRTRPIDVIIPNEDTEIAPLQNAFETDWLKVNYHHPGTFTLNYIDGKCWGDPSDPPIVCLPAEDLEQGFAIFIQEEALLETVGLAPEEASDMDFVTPDPTWDDYVANLVTLYIGPPFSDSIMQGLALHTYLKFSNNQFHPSADKTLSAGIALSLDLGYGPYPDFFKVRYLQDCLSPSTAVISGFLRAVDFWVRTDLDYGVPHNSKLDFIEGPFPNGYLGKHCFSKNHKLVYKFKDAIEKEMGVKFTGFGNGTWVWGELSKQKQKEINTARLVAIKKHTTLFKQLSAPQQQQLADAWDVLKKTGNECAWDAVGRRDDMSKYWTAAALWDLMDKHYETSDDCSDAFDSLHFLDAAGVLGVFLNTSPHPSMLSLRDDLKAWWDEGGVLAEPFIDAIYHLNHMYDGGGLD